MTAGLTLPFVTAADPDRAGEGSLDPLGLARIAERLADELAPEVTARMSRVRFVTAIAVASHVLFEPTVVGADGTPAYLAFEWYVVEAMARKRPETGTDAIPGIQKARARLRGHPRRHLDKNSYLQVPKVFGFHGVYKRLAKDLEIVDDDLVLRGRGDELVEIWEREQQLDGFSRRTAGSIGGNLAAVLAGEVRRALEKGAVQLGPTSKWWREISAAFAPGSAGIRERRRLWRWLTETRHPVRRELAKLVAADRNLSCPSERVSNRS